MLPSADAVISPLPFSNLFELPFAAYVAAPSPDFTTFPLPSIYALISPSPFSNLLEFPFAAYVAAPSPIFKLFEEPSIIAFVSPFPDCILFVSPEILTCLSFPSPVFTELEFPFTCTFWVSPLPDSYLLFEPEIAKSTFPFPPLKLLFSPSIEVI